MGGGGAEKMVLMKGDRHASVTRVFLFAAGTHPWCWPSRAHQDFPLQVPAAAGGEGVLEHMGGPEPTAQPPLGREDGEMASFGGRSGVNVPWLVSNVFSINTSLNQWLRFAVVSSFPSEKVETRPSSFFEALLTSSSPFFSCTSFEESPSRACVASVASTHS